VHIGYFLFQVAHIFDLVHGRPCVAGLRHVKAEAKRQDQFLEGFLRWIEKKFVPGILYRGQS
jgi:hypothetical protein